MTKTQPTGKQRAHAKAINDRAMAIAKARKAAKEQVGQSRSWWLNPETFYEQAKAERPRMHLSGMSVGPREVE